MPLDKFRSLFSESKLYFRSVALFQDAFEASFPYETSPDASRSNDQSAGRTDTEELDRIIGNAAAEMSRFQYYANTRPITYASCWTMRRSECVGMWTNYLSGKPGVAVRSTFNRLAASFVPAAEDIFIGKVGYIDYLTPGDAKRLHRLSPALLKFVPYEYEQ